MRILKSAILLGPAALCAAAALADVGIEKTGTPPSLETGWGLSYTITVTNDGPTAREVEVHDALPADVVFGVLYLDGVWLPPGNPDCSFPAQGRNDVPIDCVVTLAAQDVAVFTIYATMRFCFLPDLTITNTATACAAPDPPVSSSWSFVSPVNPDQEPIVCDDGNYCTEYDRCYDGVCMGQPLNGCPDGSVCTIDGCDPSVGCTYTPIECEDGDPCTDNACHPDTGCFFPLSAAGTPCPFTGPCAVSGVCNGAGACVGVSVCDDGNPCTNDFTDYQNACACSHAASPAGTSCSDEDPCTLDDRCDGAGLCVGSMGELPPEVGSTLRVERTGNRAIVSWTAVQHADAYHMLRGWLSNLPVGSASEACIAVDPSGPSADDFFVPPAGSGFWYVARGVNSCLGPGPYGFQGNHGAPGVPRTSTACP